MLIASIDNIFLPPMGYSDTLNQLQSVVVKIVIFSFFVSIRNGLENPDTVGFVHQHDYDYNQKIL